MVKYFFPLTLLAFAAAVQAAEELPADPATAARVAVALALAQRQAAVKPETPPVLCNCYQTGDAPKNCVCPKDDCTCRYGLDCRTFHPPAVASPTYSVLVISRSACPPCEKVRAALQDVPASDFAWDIWKDAPDVEAKYGGVAAYPTILLLRDGKEVGRHVGYMSMEQIKAWIVNPKKPIAEGENVKHGLEVADNGILHGMDYQGDLARGYRPLPLPTYRPMMRYASPAACGT